MKVSLKWLGKPVFWAVVLGIAIPCVIILPVAIRDRGKDDLEMIDHLMFDMYRQLEAGSSSQQLLESLSENGKGLVERYDIGWLDDVLPIETACGRIVPFYLPNRHIVVYAASLPRSGKHKGRHISYFGNGGRKGTCEDREELDMLIRTTHVGTFEILLCDSSETEKKPEDFRQLDAASLGMYRLLRQLVDEDESYILAAIKLAAKKDQSVNNWLHSILRRSITTPDLPKAKPDDTEAFHASWSEWYQKNAHSIKFTNRFLFKDTIPK